MPAMWRVWTTEGVQVTAHACTPHPLTTAMLKDGSKSSFREFCTHCATPHTWIVRNSDGAVVILDTSGRRK